ncbi:MAG: hypothetical protein K1X78_08685 [Verrucomicrobiaceae bacterium]|nr:hypothetical protein [Verrucomicrobiaceae bacterium]
MKGHLLIQAISPGLRTEIITYLQREQRGAYRAAIDNLAVQKKLRPVFVLKKTKEQQVAWLYDQLRIKTGDALAEQVIQIWLLKGQPGMLATFLDAIGVEHEKGEVKDELPEDIDVKKAREGINALLKAHPPESVALYLQIFQQQKQGGWPGLTEALASFPDLVLQAPA